jgi:hypothetical protein
MIIEGMYGSDYIYTSQWHKTANDHLTRLTSSLCLDDPFPSFCHVDVKIYLRLEEA